MRELKPIEVGSLKANNLQVEGWVLGDENLTFDFAFSSNDPLKLEGIKNPLSKIHLHIDTSSFNENESSFIKGKRGTFVRKKKELIVVSIPTNYSYEQIKKKAYPLILRVETNDEFKNYTFTFK